MIEHLPAQEHHQMILQHTDQEGVDEYYCPTCGRRLLIQWPPDYKKSMLEPGDENAIHSGGKGGLSMGLPSVQQIEAEEAENNERLAPWIEWMNRVNFDRLWGEAD